METLQGGGIAQRIRTLSDNATRSIFGGNWWLGSPLSLRVITDISTPSNVNSGTLKMLMNRGPMRTLPGVHAKVYIFDEEAVVTSANLTETAFTKRHEIGFYLDKSEAQETIKRFQYWWDLSKTDLTEGRLAAWKPAEPAFADEQGGEGLAVLWQTPAKPPSSLFEEPEHVSHKKFKSYQKFISSYKELASTYFQMQ
jgi:hypothetical protein